MKCLEIPNINPVETMAIQKKKKPRKKSLSGKIIILSVELRFQWMMQMNEEEKKPNSSKIW